MVNNIFDIWYELQSMGYDEGDSILYYDFVQTCENLDIYPDDYIKDELCNLYNVEIG